MRELCFMKSLKRIIVTTFLLLPLPSTSVIGCPKVMTSNFFKGGAGTYIIDKNYDLKGAAIAIPSGSTLIFKKGSLRNGTIVGIDTKLLGLKKNNFKNLKIAGEFIVSEVSYSMFSSYESDTKLLSAMFNLALSGRDTCILTLEKNRVYDFFAEYDAKKAGYTGHYEFKGSENKTIIGNGAIINDRRKISSVSSSACHFLLSLYGVRNFDIRELNYQNKEEKIVWDTKTTDPGYKGYGFICFRGKSCDVSVSIPSMTGCRYGIYVGDAVSTDDLTPSQNIIINIDRAFDVGYSVLTENVDKFSVIVNSESVHRTCYIVSSSNGHITAKVKTQHTAPYQILLCEKIWNYNGKSYSKGTNNITIDVEDLGSDYAKDGSALCGLGMWFDNNVSFGNAVGEWRNIEIKATMNNNTPIEIGAFGASINVKDETDILAKRNYVLDHINVTVDDARENKGKLSRLVWFTTNSNATVSNVNLVLKSDVSWVILSGVNNNNVRIKNSNIELLSVMGDVSIEKSSVKRMNYYQGYVSDDSMKNGYILDFKDSSVNQSDVATMRSKKARVIIN